MDASRCRRTWFLVNSAAIGLLAGAGVAEGPGASIGPTYVILPAVATLVTSAVYLSLTTLESIYLDGSSATARDTGFCSPSMEGDA